MDAKIPHLRDDKARIVQINGISHLIGRCQRVAVFLHRGRGFHIRPHSRRGSDWFFRSRLLRGDALHIGHDLFHKGAGPAALQILADSNGVDVLKVVQLLLGIESVLLNELGDPALHLCPGQLHGFRTARTDGECPIAAILMGEPCGGIPVPRVVFHIADNSAFAVHIPIPRAEGIVNILLGERAQKLMELRIGLVYDLLMQTAAKFRHIGVQPDQLQIAGIENGALDGGAALRYGIFMVRVAAGVAVGHILHDGGSHYRLVFVIKLPNSGGGRFGSRVMEYPCPVRAKLRFVGVNGPFCLMVDGAQGESAALCAALWNCGEGHIVLLSELFYIAFQIMRRYAAHLHAAYIGDVSGGQVQAQQLGGLLGVLTVHFKEVAHLKQHHIVGVAFLDRVVGIKEGIALGVLLELRLFRLCEVLVLADKGADSLGDIVPGYLRVYAIRLFQHDALGAVIPPAMKIAGNSAIAAACAIFLFQKVRTLFQRGIAAEKGVNPALAALHITAAAECLRDLVLGDKALRRGKYRKLGGVFPAGQGQLAELVQNSGRFVMLKAHQFPVPRVGLRKGLQLGDQGVYIAGVSQHSGQLLRFLWKAHAAQGFQSGHEVLLFGLIAHIVAHIPKGLRHLTAFISRCFYQLYIGGKDAGIQHFLNAGGGILPGNDLCVLDIPRTQPHGQVDAILRIPCGNIAVPAFDAIAAMVFLLQKGGDLLRGFLLHKLSRHTHTAVFCVAAKAQNLVDVLLGNQKSEGRFFRALRFCDAPYLLCLGGEQADLFALHRLTEKI